MSDSPKWYFVTFDPHWVRCRNHKRQQLFARGEILGKRKCPKCRMNNQLEITATATQPSGEAAKGEEGV